MVIFWPGGATNPQEVITDTCADLWVLGHFDITIQPFNSEGNVPQLVEYEVNVAGYHRRIYDTSGADRRIISEMYRILAPRGARPLTHGDLAEYTNYYRGFAGNVASDWTTDTDSGEIDLESAKFCGFHMDTLINLQSHGQETLNGVTTTRYSATVEFPGDLPDDLWEFWIDSSGRVVQMKATDVDIGVGQLVTYSGWGEPNIVVAPILTPAPTP